MKKNFVSYLTYQILTFFIPIVMTAYVSRLLGVQKIGILNFSSTVVAYFSLFAKLGIDMHGSRVIAQNRHKLNILSRKFKEIFIIQFVWGIIIAISYFFIIMVVFKNHTNMYLLYLAQGITLLSTLLDISWFIVGLEKFSIIIFRNTLVKLVSLVAVFLLVKQKEDIVIYIVLMGISTLLGMLSMWPSVMKNIDLKAKVLKNELLIEVKPILVLFLPVIATSLFTQMDTIILGKVSTMFQVGLYSTALLLVGLPKIIIQTFGSVVLPRMTALISEGDGQNNHRYLDISFKLLIFYSVGAMFGLLVVADDVSVILYGPHFLQVGTIAKIMILMFPIYTIGNIVRTQILIPSNSDKPYVISIIVASFVNIFLNLSIGYFFGAIGGAIAVLITETAITVVELLYLKKHAALPLIIKYLRIFIINGIIMFIVLEMLKKYLLSDTSIFQLIFLIITGIIIYTLLSWKMISSSVLQLTKRGLK